MSSQTASSSARQQPGILWASIAVSCLIGGIFLGRGTGLEYTYAVFIALSGLIMGSLGLLMIGHMMNEHWLAPIRSIVEAIGLTAPFLFIVAVPLAFDLGELFPWVDSRIDLPAPRAAFLDPTFFLVRGMIYILICTGISFALVRTRHPRRVSAIGLTLLTPVMNFSAYDWVLSRDPEWWSSLFGFAFCISQLLAALAAAILIALVRPAHPSTKRMISLERALLTLSLLALWTWFAQFLIVWLANLPHEIVWYLARSDFTNLALIGIALAAMFIAIVILVPSGVSRYGMIAGSVLVCLQHALYLFWLLQPEWQLSVRDAGLAAGFCLLWAIGVATALRSRPVYREENT